VQTTTVISTGEIIETIDLISDDEDEIGNKEGPRTPATNSNSSQIPQSITTRKRTKMEEKPDKTQSIPSSKKQKSITPPPSFPQNPNKGNSSSLFVAHATAASVSCTQIPDSEGEGEEDDFLAEIYFDSDDIPTHTENMLHSNLSNSLAEVVTHGKLVPESPIKKESSISARPRIAPVSLSWQASRAVAESAMSTTPSGLNKASLTGVQNIETPSTTSRPPVLVGTVENGLIIDASGFAQKDRRPS